MVYFKMKKILDEEGMLVLDKFLVLMNDNAKGWVEMTRGLR